MGKITIENIAKAADVSISTVSRVLNNKPDVDENTRLKVLNIIEEFNYQPDSVARSLVLKKTYTIGLVIPDINNPFFTEVARGIEDIAQKNSYSVIFFSTDSKFKREEKAINILQQKKVDGLIVSLSLENNNAIFELEKKDFPVIQLDRKIPNSVYPTVMIDNRNSAYEATKHLIKLGYKKIAHLSGGNKTFTSKQRMIGYKEALKKANIKIDNRYIINGDFSQKSGYEGMNKLLNGDLDKPDAVFVANDMMAFGAYRACKNKQIEIPEDIAIMGHDNVAVSDLVNPPLTTMAQPKYKLGSIACEKLLKLIKLKSVNSFNSGEFPEDEIISTQLVKRDST